MMAVLALVGSPMQAAELPRGWPTILQAAFDADATATSGRIKGTRTVSNSMTGRGDPKRKSGEVVRITVREGRVIDAYRDPVTGKVYIQEAGGRPHPSGTSPSYDYLEVLDALPRWDPPPEQFEMHFDKSGSDGPRRLVVARGSGMTKRSVMLADRHVEVEQLDADHAKEVGSFIDKTFGKLPSSRPGQAAAAQVFVKDPPASPAWAERALAGDLTGALVEKYPSSFFKHEEKGVDGRVTVLGRATFDPGSASDRKRIERRLKQIPEADRARGKPASVAVAIVSGITVDPKYGNRVVEIWEAFEKPTAHRTFEVAIEYRPGPTPGDFEIANVTERFKQVEDSAGKWRWATENSYAIQSEELNVTVDPALFDPASFAVPDGSVVSDYRFKPMIWYTAQGGLLSDEEVFLLRKDGRAWGRREGAIDSGLPAPTIPSQRRPWQVAIILTATALLVGGIVRSRRRRRRAA